MLTKLLNELKRKDHQRYTSGIWVDWISLNISVPDCW